jgi:hypothetical protein
MKALWKLVNIRLCPAVALALSVAAPASIARTSPISYQGVLTVEGRPANGSYDLSFQLFDALTGGNQVSLTITNANQAVSNGLFRATLDFGGDAFSGSERWLQIGVRTNGSAEAFVLLAPRQLVTAAPYALYALSANVAQTAGSLAATNVMDQSPQAQAVGQTVTTGANNVFTGSNDFSGNTTFGKPPLGSAAGFTNIPAANFTGTLQAGQFPAITGDVTTKAGSLATSIAAGAVSYAKMQNISASQVLLGRSSAGAGSPQEVPVGTALGWLGTTRGDILEYGSSGWSVIGPANAGYPLLSQGSGADPAYGTLPASSITPGGALPPLNGSALTGLTGANVAGTVPSAASAGYASISANPTNGVLTNSIYATNVTSIGAATNQGGTYFGSAGQAVIDSMGDITTSGLITSTASGANQFSGAIQAVGFQGLPGTASAMSVGDGTVTTAILNGTNGTLSAGGVTATNGMTNLALTASELIGTDTANGQTSIAVGSGLQLAGGTLSATGGGGSLSENNFWTGSNSFSAVYVTNLTANLISGNGANLSDIPLSALAQGGASLNQVPIWNGSAWAPGDQSGGSGGSATNAISVVSSNSTQVVTAATNLDFWNSETIAAGVTNTGGRADIGLSIVPGSIGQSQLSFVAATNGGPVPIVKVTTPSVIVTNGTTQLITHSNVLAVSFGNSFAGLNTGLTNAAGQTMDTAINNATNRLGTAAYSPATAFDAFGTALNATNGLSSSELQSKIGAGVYDPSGAALNATNPLSALAYASVGAGLTLSSGTLAATSGGSGSLSANNVWTGSNNFSAVYVTNLNVSTQSVAVVTATNLTATLVSGNGANLVNIPLSGLAQGGASLNQVPVWNGSAWAPGDQSGGSGGGATNAVSVVSSNSTQVVPAATNLDFWLTATIAPALTNTGGRADVGLSIVPGSIGQSQLSFVAATNGGPIAGSQVVTGLGYAPATNTYAGISNAVQFVIATNGGPVAIVNVTAPGQIVTNGNSTAVTLSNQLTVIGGYSNGITGTLNVQGQYGTNGLFAGNYGLLLTNGLGSITLSNGAIIPSAGVLQPINGPANLTLSAGGAYNTNLTASITLGSFAGVPSAALWSIYLRCANSSSSTYTVTFPAGCIGTGNGTPPVYYVTNGTRAVFQISGWGTTDTNVNWFPYY